MFDFLRPKRACQYPEPPQLVEVHEEVDLKVIEQFWVDVAASWKVHTGNLYRLDRDKSWFHLDASGLSFDAHLSMAFTEEACGMIGGFEINIDGGTQYMEGNHLYQGEVGHRVMNHVREHATANKPMLELIGWRKLHDPGFHEFLDQVLIPH